MNMLGGMVIMTGYPVMVVVVVVITQEMNATRKVKGLINTMVGCLCMNFLPLYEIFKKVFLLIY